MNKIKTTNADDRSMRDILADVKSVISEECTQSDNRKLEALIEESIEVDNKDRKFFRGVLYFILVLLFLLIASIINIVILNRQVGNLQRDQVEKTNIINSLQWSDSMLNQYMKLTKDSIENTKSLHFRSKKGKALTYEDIASSNDSLVIVVENLKSESSTMKSKLDLAQRNYNIQFVETKKYIKIRAPHLDSALILLPKYRSILHYDKDDDAWYTKDSE